MVYRTTHGVEFIITNLIQNISMKIVIIGAVAAGAKAAAKSKRLLPDAEVIIYTREENISYSACGLPYYIEGNFEDASKLIIRTISDFESKGIKVFNKHNVNSINPDEHKIHVTNLETEESFDTGYDKLLIATGAEPYIPDIKNINLKKVFTLKTLNDGINIRNTMLASRHAVIIGGGYIGLELLEAFLQNGLSITMLEKGFSIMNTFDEDIASLISAYILKTYGDKINIITYAEVSEFIGEKEIAGVKLTDGQIINTEMAVICSGVKPVVNLAKECGIELGQTGAIKVNSRMLTNIPDIYAAGDCVEKINMISDTPMWIPLGSTANKEGRCAALNMCGTVDDFEGVLGSAVTRFMDMTMSRTGLSSKVAESLGYDVVTAIVTKRDKANYMPTVGYVTLKLIADRRSHKILGAQSVGSGDADKRINTLSTGLIRGMTVEELNDADMTYAPPYSTSIDPLIDAARILKDKLACCIH